MGTVHIREESVYICPVCGENFYDELEAYECCSYECEVCNEWYEEFLEAEACCKTKCVICGESYEDAAKTRKCCDDYKNPDGTKKEILPCIFCGKGSSHGLFKCNCQANLFKKEGRSND